MWVCTGEKTGSPSSLRNRTLFCPSRGPFRGPGCRGLGLGTACSVSGCGRSCACRPGGRPGGPLGSAGTPRRRCWQNRRTGIFPWIRGPWGCWTRCCCFSGGSPIDPGQAGWPGSPGMCRSSRARPRPARPEIVGKNRHWTFI